MVDQSELNAKMERVESLVTALEGCPDPMIREQARELVATLMEFHEAGLSRIFEILAEHESAGAMAAMGKDSVAGSLLMLYGLHPTDLKTRVNDALEQVRPALRAHRGGVELVDIEDAKVYLRLEGTCNGCPSSTTTFRNLIEGAIHEKAPEIEEILVEGISG